MKTTATNRKIRQLLTDIQKGVLVPRPEFQRRLVWANKHKNAFIETVLKDYPFPEIYVAASEVDTATGEGTEMLVDGQQRITTLRQYFLADKDLKLERGIPRYADLDEDKKRAFLDYDVVVRDLGNVSIEQIKEVFKRINSTRYALNAMEIHNARFEGAFKLFGDEMAARTFFSEHKIFSSTEIKRMQDTRYALTVVATIMGGYFNRDDDLEDYLKRYNDEFPGRDEMAAHIDEILTFIEACGFPLESRAWSKTDLFNLLVELYDALFKRRLRLTPSDVGHALEGFYKHVGPSAAPGAPAANYYLATVQASNDRASRATRGKVVRQLLQEAAVEGEGLF